MFAVAAFNALSTLLEDNEICCELVLRAPSAASTLEDELDNDREEVLFVEIEPLTAASAASMLEDELERLKLEV